MAGTAIMHGVSVKSMGALLALGILLMVALGLLTAWLDDKMDGR